MVLSRQKNDINILADEAEWGFVEATESTRSQVMLGFLSAVEHAGRLSPSSGALFDSWGSALALGGGLMAPRVEMPPATGRVPRATGVSPAGPLLVTFRVRSSPGSALAGRRPGPLSRAAWLRSWPFCPWL